MDRISFNGATLFRLLTEFAELPQQCVIDFDCNSAIPCIQLRSSTDLFRYLVEKDGIMQISRQLATLCVLAPSILCGVAKGGSVSVNTVSRGAYFTEGGHDSGNDSYVAGVLNSTQSSRDFFGFNLVNVNATVTAAQLVLYNPDFNTFSGAHGSGTFTVGAVSTALADLESSHSNGDLAGQVIYSDLGSGTQYGSYNYSLLDNGRYISIDLNSAVVDAINSRTSSSFVIGGKADSFPVVFDGTATNNPSDGRTSLVLTTADSSAPTPLPAAVWGGLPLLGLAGLFRWRAAVSNQ